MKRPPRLPGALSCRGCAPSCSLRKRYRPPSPGAESEDSLTAAKRREPWTRTAQGKGQGWRPEPLPTANGAFTEDA